MATYDRDDYLPFRVRALEDRVDKIEAVKPEVMAYELKSLVEEVKALKRQLMVTAFSITGGSVLFFISVFQILR